MSKDAMALLIARLDALPGVTEKLGVLANLQVEPQWRGLRSFTHWNLLEQAFAKGLLFGRKLATAEVVCRWAQQQESKLELARESMDDMEGDDDYPDFVIIGVAACAAVHQDTEFLQRMFTQGVIHLGGTHSLQSVFVILGVAGLLRAPKLVEMMIEWESVSHELFDVAEWAGLLQAALWTGDKEWADWCRATIGNRLFSGEYRLIEKDGESFGAGPGDTIRLWRTNLQT